MFHVYFDDCGTDSSSQLAIAACYVSTKRCWDEFGVQWNRARSDENFDFFHMTDFAAARKHAPKPYCDWDTAKKERVYQRLVGIINENKRSGFGMAIPKEVFDREVPSLPEELRLKTGTHHFTFAFKCVLTMIETWRSENGIKAPMQYIFDRVGKGRGEIKAVWDNIKDFDAYDRLGMERDGYSFQDKRCFKPLQASDILAWQLHDHMRRVILPGRRDKEDCHPHFLMLRVDQNMKLGFMTQDNFLTTIQLLYRALEASKVEQKELSSK